MRLLVTSLAASALLMLAGCSGMHHKAHGGGCLGHGAAKCACKQSCECQECARGDHKDCSCGHHGKSCGA